MIFNSNKWKIRPHCNKIQNTFKRVQSTETQIAGTNFLWAFSSYFKLWKLFFIHQNIVENLPKRIVTRSQKKIVSPQMFYHISCLSAIYKSKAQYHNLHFTSDSFVSCLLKDCIQHTRVTTALNSLQPPWKHHPKCAMLIATVVLSFWGAAHLCASLYSQCIRKHTSRYMRK